MTVPFALGMTPGARLGPIWSASAEAAVCRLAEFVDYCHTSARPWVTEGSGPPPGYGGSGWY